MSNFILTEIIEYEIDLGMFYFGKYVPPKKSIDEQIKEKNLRS